jgi:hypothetical protein
MQKLLLLLCSVLVVEVVVGFLHPLETEVVEVEAEAVVTFMKQYLLRIWQLLLLVLLGLVVLVEMRIRMGLVVAHPFLEFWLLVVEVVGLLEKRLMQTHMAGAVGVHWVVLFLKIQQVFGV